MPWNLDTAHSSIEFSVRHMVIASTKGRFADYTVAAEVDEANLANSSATVTINVASIDTRNDDRDNHLRSADFFDVANHPTMTFKTKKLESKGGGDYKVTGDLTIKGVTKEVTLNGEVSGPVKDPWGGTRVGFSANGKLDRKDWGLVYNAALETGGVLIGDEVKLTIDTELVKA